MRIDGGDGSGGRDSCGACAMSGLQFVLVLLAQAAISGLVNRPSHMVLAPMKGVVTIFLLFGFAIFWRHLLPCLVLLLVFLVRRVLLIPLFLTPLFAISFVLVICQFSQFRS